jgi:hypothetical protein
MSNRVGNALAGHYGETVITDDVSDSKRQKIEGYMAWKWGIESQLPIGHPYKASPPYEGETPLTWDQTTHTFDSDILTWDQIRN